MLQEKNNKYGVWISDFMREASHNERATCAKFCFDSFISRINLCPDNDPEISAWVNSAEGQATLLTLVQDIQAHIESVAEFALPAHDIRQILFKDAAEGLRFFQMERPQGFNSAFIVAMISHDVGRLLEGAIYNPQILHDQWIPHAQLSYSLLNRILVQPKYDGMPQSLKNHLLYAVAAHSGMNGETYMSRAVQTADRMQMIGAEGFYRALPYMVCFMEGHIKYPMWDGYERELPAMDDHKSVFSYLEYFSRNMLDNVGSDDGHKQWQRRVAIENVAILLALCHGNDDLYQKVFAPELHPTKQFGERKNRIPADVFGAAKKLFVPVAETDWCTSQFELTRRIFKDVQNVKGAAPLHDKMKSSIIRAMGVLMRNERAGLYQALTLAEKLRDEQDRADIEVCRQVMEQYPNTYLSAIAEKALEYAPEHLLEASIAYEARSIVRGAGESSPPALCVPR